MAERRMFAKSIVLSDAFLDMPLSARCLYFTLGMLADDDGFVGNPRSVMRQCGASQDDMSILLQKRYVLGFESGVIVIKHWRMNNYLRTDRYHTTTYIEEKENLVIDKKGAYTEKDGNKAITDVGIPSGNQVVDGRYTEVSIGKDSIDKDSIIPPLPPIGEQTEYDFNKHTNLVNYQHIKDTMRDEYIDYIVNHTELDECVTTWMKYKDERKPKSNNHYAETGLIQLLNKIYKQCLNHGINNVLNIIEESMSNNYQGIIWNQIKTQNNSQTSVFDAWAKA